MSSTNKTTNYDLSQYIGTDKPTYLGDYNSDMNKIDAQMKKNADATASAMSIAGTANSNATQAKSQAEAALKTGTQAQNTAENAQNTASTASQNATTALNTASAANDKANTAKDAVDKNVWVTSGNIVKSAYVSGNIIVKYNAFLKSLVFHCKATIGGSDVPSGTPFATIPANIMSMLDISSARTLDAVFVYVGAKNDFVSYPPFKLDVNGDITCNLNMFKNQNILAQSFVPVDDWS